MLIQCELWLMRIQCECKQCKLIRFHYTLLSYCEHAYSVVGGTVMQQDCISLCGALFKYYSWYVSLV